MSHKTLKYRKIHESPHLNKPVDQLPGIGPAYARTLEGIGCTTVLDVYDKLKILEVNKIKFQEWMKNACGIPDKQSSEAFDCLKDWKVQFEDKRCKTCNQPLPENK